MMFGASVSWRLHVAVYLYTQWVMFVAHGVFILGFVIVICQGGMTSGKLLQFDQTSI